MRDREVTGSPRINPHIAPAPRGSGRKANLPSRGRAVHKSVGRGAFSAGQWPDGRAHIPRAGHGCERPKDPHASCQTTSSTSARAAEKCEGVVFSPDFFGPAQQRRASPTVILASQPDGLAGISCADEIRNWSAASCRRGRDSHPYRSGDATCAARHIPARRPGGR